MKPSKINIAIIGLGYVGLPLAVEFGKKNNVLGFDINQQRILELKKNIDKTNELTSDEIKQSKNLSFSAIPSDLSKINVYIITVPTPVDDHNVPDLSALLKACEMVGSHIENGDTIIFESTVYPGATEEKCVPILEKKSNLKYNDDFFVGYSPERINPGDKSRKLKDIKKITSGSNAYAREFVDMLYKTIIDAGTYSAPSIKVAEAAKVIENIQRDVNIALINELSVIFKKLEIDTHEVLQAAQTKWNFLPFVPGLVGGHCIGVDPYYLSFKAQSIGCNPEMILAGRSTNERMPKHAASVLIKEMIKKNIHINEGKILVLGLTFKENCPDLRNTKVFDLITELKEYGVNIDVYDPYCDIAEAKEHFNISVYKDFDDLNKSYYDSIILAVNHDLIMNIGLDKILKLAKSKKIFFDMKSAFDKSLSDIRL